MTEFTGKTITFIKLADYKPTLTNFEEEESSNTQIKPRKHATIVPTPITKKIRGRSRYGKPMNTIAE